MEKQDANQSMEQQQQEQQNEMRNSQEEPMEGIDKKLNGPNRPST
jgi:hypothetical protein